MVFCWKCGANVSDEEVRVAKQKNIPLICRNCGEEIPISEENGQENDYQQFGASETNLNSGSNSMQSYENAYQQGQAAPQPGYPAGNGYVYGASGVQGMVQAPSGGGAYNLNNDIFIDKNEMLVGSLGSGYLRNFLSFGKIEKACVMVSDKRVYFKGKAYDLNSGISKLVKVNKSSVVDLHDVTNTDINSKSNIGSLIVSIFFGLAGLIFMILGLTSRYGEEIYWSIFGGCFLFFIIFLLIFIFSQKETLKINFANGGIGLKTKWFPPQEIADFRRALYLAKDRANDRRYGVH